MPVHYITNSAIPVSNALFKQYIMELCDDVVWKNTSIANASESTDINDLYLKDLFMLANNLMLKDELIQSYPIQTLKYVGSKYPSSVLGKMETETDMEYELRLYKYSGNKNLIPSDLRPECLKMYINNLTEGTNSDGDSSALDDNGTDHLKEIDDGGIYVEKNNYYRMLNGLPDLDDTDYIYNDNAGDLIYTEKTEDGDFLWKVSYIENIISDPSGKQITIKEIDKDNSVPLHKLSHSLRIRMENKGVLDTISKLYPTKLYVKYCGKRQVRIFDARSAKRFDLLYHNKSESTKLNDEFDTIYYKCKNIVNSVYYNDSLRKSNKLYDNFLALTILFMTVEYLQHKYLEVDISRNFYDLESIKLIYDSYGIPFYEKIPIEYHVNIVKNINKLVGSKGSSEVFLKLFELFTAKSMELYTYYLVRTPKQIDQSTQHYAAKIIKDLYKPYDEEYKSKYHKDGEVLNYDSYKAYTYINPEGEIELKHTEDRIYFSKSEFYDDPSTSIKDINNEIDYNSVTDDDPYWIEDTDLKEHIENSDFNYTETKYIGIQTIFNLMRMVYEHAYIFKLITDNINDFSITDENGDYRYSRREYDHYSTNREHLTFEWPEIGIDRCELADLIIYIASLYCNYYGYAGTISVNSQDIFDVYTFSDIGDVYGYNFEIYNSDKYPDDIVDLFKNCGKRKTYGTDDEYYGSGYVHNMYSEIIDDLETHEDHDNTETINTYKNLNTIKNNRVEKICKLINDMDIENISDVNQRYAEILELRKLIISGYIYANTLEEFEIYRNLYFLLLESEHALESFTSKNTDTPSIYTCFASVDDNVNSMLKDLNANNNNSLYNRYVKIVKYDVPKSPDEETDFVYHNEEVGQELMLAIDKFESILPEIKELNITAGININHLLNALYDILKFFKSAKAEIVEFNLIYEIKEKGEHFIKFMDKMCRAEFVFTDPINDIQFYSDWLYEEFVKFYFQEEVVKKIDKITHQQITYYPEDLQPKIEDSWRYNQEPRNPDYAPIIIDGYYYNNKFYKEYQDGIYEEEIIPSTDNVYRDYVYGSLYVWENNTYRKLNISENLDIDEDPYNRWIKDPKILKDITTIDNEQQLFTDLHVAGVETTYSQTISTQNDRLYYIDENGQKRLVG